MTLLIPVKQCVRCEFVNFCRGRCFHCVVVGTENVLFGQRPQARAQTTAL